MKSRAIKMSMALGIAMILLITPMGISDDDHCGESDIKDLVAGRKHDLVGSVEISNDGDTLYIEFSTNSPWLLEETHVHVAGSAVEIPQTKKGNAIPGKFEYKEDHDYITSFTYEIPFSKEGDPVCGDEIFIAAHAVVAMEIPCRTVNINCPPPICYDTETAWGDGDDFPGKDWSMYFSYEIECCAKVPDFPEEITFKMSRTGNNCYWVTTIYVGGEEYEIPDDWDTDRTYWWGWCIDLEGQTGSGTYSATLSVPEPGDDDYCKWNKINWIMNNRDGYDWEEVQAAIWHIWIGTTIVEGPNAMGNGVNLDVGGTQDEDAQELADAAICCWTPQEGDWVGVILTPPGKQICLIEFDP